MSKKIKYDLVNLQGKKAGQVELDPTIFAAEVDQSIVHKVVNWQRAKKRAGTHSTLSRSMMDNTSKKLYRQKGTGRARAGSRYSPTRVGGATAFGPKPKSYEYRMNKKVKMQAMAAVLTDKCSSKTLYILDQLNLPSGKTKDFQAAMKSIDQDAASKKVLVIMSDKAENSEVEDPVVKAGRNIKKVKFLAADGLNVYDLVNADCVMFDQNCLPQIENRFSEQEGTKDKE